MLDMLEEFDRVCRKHDIKYFLIAGSLLGAIRHKGFIPWDDDVDIALFRKDYKKLESILPKELPAHLFLQTLATDPEYDASHMRIRDSRTTGVFSGGVNRRARYNMGIFVDIFVLDGIPQSLVSRKVLTWFSHRWMWFINIRWHRGRLHFKAKVAKCLFSLIWSLLGVERIYAFREWMFGRYNVAVGGECVQKACDWGYDHKYRYDVSDLQDVREADFEYLTLMVPKRAEVILEKTYGDWRKIVKGGALHSFVELNPFVDYKTTLVEKFGYKMEELAALP